MTLENEVVNETSTEINIEKNNDSIENNVIVNENNTKETSVSKNLNNQILKFDLDNYTPSESKRMFYFTGDGYLNIDVFDGCAITNNIVSTSGTSGSKKGNFTVNYSSGGALYPPGSANFDSPNLFIYEPATNFTSTVVNNLTLVGTDASKLRSNVFIGEGNVEDALYNLRANAEDASGYSLTAACANFNVSTNSVVYYFGNLYTRTPSTTAFSSRAIIIPKTGKLTFASVNWARDDTPDPDTLTPATDGPKIGIKINNESAVELLSFNSMLASAGGNESSSTLSTTVNAGDLIWITYSSNFWNFGANALSLHVNLFIETNY